MHKMRHVGLKDVVFAVSFRRGLRTTVEGLRQAHANRAFCVAVTDSLLSPLAEVANECFLNDGGDAIVWSLLRCTHGAF